MEKQNWLEYAHRVMEAFQIDAHPGALSLDEPKLMQLERYSELLLEWNQKMNLTAITDPQAVLTKHFFDSAAGIGFLKPDRPVLDIGTGAGFPGMVLKILAPEQPFVLLDSLNKRLIFLEAVKEALQISDCMLVHARAEEAAHQKEYRGQFGTVVSRAVAPLPVLLEYSLPFLEKDGVFLAYKGPSLGEELKESQRALKRLGAEVEAVHTAAFPDGSDQEGWEHQIAVIRKIAPTNPIYPRKQAKIKSDPL